MVEAVIFLNAINSLPKRRRDASLKREVTPGFQSFHFISIRAGPLRKKRSKISTAIKLEGGRGVRP